MNSVYLAGPITGLSYRKTLHWRDYAQKVLSPKIVVFSPMRAKEYLAGVECIEGSYEDIALSSARGIVARDRFDIQRCDVVLMNVLGAKIVSIGTVIEMGWADICRKPVILCIEEKGNLHDHPMFRELASYRVAELEAGIQLAKALLNE